MNDVVDQNNTEFKTLGMTMENLSVVYGLFLLIWGVVISFLSGSNSFTSYIPSIIGTPILFFSYLSVKFENKRKLFMHIVVLFGLLAFLGGLDLIRGILSGVIFKEYEQNYKIGIKILEKFINSNFDDDGFPLSRSPDDLVFLTKYLLLCHENIKDAQQYVPEFLDAIEIASIGFLNRINIGIFNSFVNVYKFT